MVEQGDILKIDGIDHTVLVVSKNRFNESGTAIVCPVVSGRSEATFAYSVDEERCVLCDNPRHLDLQRRFYSVKGHISLACLINVVDRIQSLFDYC